jgi:hypothetical protein
MACSLVAVAADVHAIGGDGVNPSTWEQIYVHTDRKAAIVLLSHIE